MKVLLHVMDTLDAAHAAAPLVRLLVGRAFSGAGA